MFSVVGEHTLCRKGSQRVGLGGNGREAIEDTIAPPQLLPDIGAAELRDDPTRLGKIRDPPHCFDDTIDNDPCIVEGVSADIVVKGLKVFAGLRRPEYLRHRLNWAATWSWGMSCPASAWARPRSIFARKHSRSITSSSVASGGSCSTAARIRCFSVLSTMSAI